MGCLSSAFGLILRLYSYLFHLVVTVFLVGIAMIAATSHQRVNLRMLPFSGDNVVPDVLLLGGIGFLVTILALTNIFRYFFPIWAAAIVYLTVRGFFFSGYVFANASEFKNALWLTVAAVGAFFGALWTLKRRRRRVWF
jgi:hypothetical protein